MPHNQRLKSWIVNFFTTYSIECDENAECVLKSAKKLLYTLLLVTNDRRAWHSSFESNKIQTEKILSSIIYQALKKFSHHFSKRF